jgi:hypothetical protein
MDSLCVGIHPSIDCDGGTGRQVIADPRDNPSPKMPRLRRSGRHRQNGGRLEIGMVGAIRSERWAASDRNRWAAYVRIRSSSSVSFANTVPTSSFSCADDRPSMLSGGLTHSLNPTNPRRGKPEMRRCPGFAPVTESEGGPAAVPVHTLALLSVPRCRLPRSQSRSPRTARSATAGSRRGCIRSGLKSLIRRAFSR